MNEQDELLQRLKAAQIELFRVAAKSGALPSDKGLSKIADVELTIAAIENALDSK
jgi:hypothetical protein